MSRISKRGYGIIICVLVFVIGLFALLDWHEYNDLRLVLIRAAILSVLMVAVCILIIKANRTKIRR